MRCALHRAKAIKRKTGARGLRSILEGILLDPMYEPSWPRERGRDCHQRDVVEGRAEPLYIYSDRREDLESAPRFRDRKALKFQLRVQCPLPIEVVCSLTTLYRGPGLLLQEPWCPNA